MEKNQDQDKHDSKQQQLEQALDELREQREALRELREAQDARIQSLKKLEECVEQQGAELHKLAASNKELVKRVEVLEWVQGVEGEEKQPEVGQNVDKNAQCK